MTAPPGRSLKCILLSEKMPLWKGYILHDPTIRRFGKGKRWRWHLPGSTSGKGPTQETRGVGSLLGWGDPLEEETATHSNTTVWRISWTSEPGGPQYTGLQRVRHDWSDLACTHGNTKNNNSKNQWFPGVTGEGRINRWGTEDFQGSETTPHGTVKADAGNYKCVQWQCATLRVNLNTHYRLRVTMTYQHRFTNGHKGAIWGGVFMTGTPCISGGAEPVP